jgi:SSS family solute:Na+ symporter
MVVASLILWGVVWMNVGGWEGLTQKLAAIDTKLPQTLLHVGGYSPGGVSPVLVAFGFLVVLTTYAVINQYEAIRFLGARSEWDFKMAALVACVTTSICLWFNVIMGPLAKADFPDLQVVDQAYPLMVKKYLPPGLIGLVLAGVVAAGYSTFDSIGIGISSLFVRDLYARFIVRNASDEHYTFVGRVSVPIIIALGFVYVPFLSGGMLAFYLRLTGAIGVPLMTVILMGIFTRVHRKTGIIGLLVGLIYGISAILGDRYKWPLPVWYTNTWWAYLWNIVLPVISMLIASKIIDLRRGPAKEEELKGLLYTRQDPTEDFRELMGKRLRALEGTWLQKTLQQAPRMPKYPFPLPATGLSWFKRPGLWATLYLVIACYLLFVVLW